MLAFLPTFNWTFSFCSIIPVLPNLDSNFSSFSSVLGFVVLLLGGIQDRAQTPLAQSSDLILLL